MTVLGTELEGWILFQHIVYAFLAWCSGNALGIILFYKPEGATGVEKLRRAAIGLIIVFGVPTFLLGRHLVNSGHKETAFAFMAVAVPIGILMGIGAAKHFRM
jgi:hypothetical protein